MCDFRPFYGRIFKYYLRGYQFWGYCDIDIVFGDLSKVLNEDFLSNIDIFTAYDKSLVGHFTVLRNTEEINNLCLSIKNYDKIAKNKETNFMDELLFYKVIVISSSIRFKKPKSYEEELKNPSALIGVTISSANKIVGINSKGRYFIKCKEGHVFLLLPNSNPVECLYAHFMGMKIKPFWLFYSSYKKYDCFYFSPIGFLPLKNFSPNFFFFLTS